MGSSEQKSRKRCRKCYWYSGVTDTCDYFMLTNKHKTGRDESCDSFRKDDIKAKQRDWLYGRRSFL